MDTNSKPKKIDRMAYKRQISINDCLKIFEKKNELDFNPLIEANNFVFISYAHKNKNEFNEILKVLKNHSINFWYDHFIPPSSDWRDIIADHIARCSLFLALISNEYLKSKISKKEIKYALSKEKEIYPIFLEKINFSVYNGGRGIELEISDKQALFKYKLQKEDFSKRLYLGIMEILSK